MSEELNTGHVYAAAQKASLESFTDTYIMLLDELTERKMGLSEAADRSFAIISRYMDYQNNNKYAEATNVTFIAEEDPEG
jgi:hypothetical protein